MGNGGRVAPNEKAAPESALKPTRGWRAFYGPRLWRCGATLDEARRLPDGILVVVAYEVEDYAPGRPYRRVLAGSDWYFWVEDSAGSLLVGSLVDFSSKASSVRRDHWLSNAKILRAFPDAIVKRGVWASGEEYEAARQVALKALSAP